MFLNTAELFLKKYNTVKKMIGHFERNFNKKMNIKLGIFEKNPV